MKEDFSGYATKANVQCSDGRVILPDAFKEQHQMRVPLVWQHDHNDPTNVLGHAILENRKDGVYAYAFFNDTPKAQLAKTQVQHGDITQLSIWANELIQRSKKVFHGAIREVSLVLSGANPEARIENVTIAHGDGDEYTLDDEAIIRSGEFIIHGNQSEETEDSADETEETEDSTDETEETEDSTDETEETEDSLSDEAKTVYHSFTEDQKNVVNFMTGLALEKAGLKNNNLGHADLGPDATLQDIYETFNKKQLDLVHYMIQTALSEASLQQDNLNNNELEGTEMKHNVFESDNKDADKHVLSHSDLNAILTEAKTRGASLKETFEKHTETLAHGIDNIDLMFPDAVNVSGNPEWLKRRTEWVDVFLSAATKSPISRIKTFSADITEDDARAKGYIKGAFKKEEFFPIVRRITTPTTVYKKQALDRDDMIDITDFDVVIWLKSEMRIMLDEEVARAALLGDGRDISSEDKINDQNIRPIATDHELYTTVVNVNVTDALSSMTEVVDAVIANRGKYKGSGSPMAFMSETWIAKFLVLRDTLGHRLYKNLEELALELRVSRIVPCEVMESDPTTVLIMVNPVDYRFGADKGGNIAMFDDFDIDYNKNKYLIETRLSGALTKLKSAIVVKAVASTDVLVAPNEPSFNTTTGVLTIVDQTGVVYKNGATVVNAAGSPYAAIASGASVTIDATPATGYYFATSDDDSWTFTRD